MSAPKDTATLIERATALWPSEHHLLCNTRKGSDCDCYMRRTADARAAIFALAAAVEGRTEKCAVERLTERAEAAEDERDRYAAALRWYADPDHWNADEWGDPIVIEGETRGYDIARDALAGSADAAAGDV